MKTSPFAHLLLGATSLAGLAAAALAQQAPAPATTATAAAPATPAPGQSGLEEIVVTAQRREQNLQNVPLSVIAVGSDQIRKTGIQTLEALNHSAPDVFIERVGLYPGAASLSMRGVGYSGIESFADPDVAVYVNGIYQARNATALSQTLDVSSIEVLRGPQGTLFGRNAFAGAISLQTNRPNMHDTSGSATATIGNDGLVDADFVGNLPIVDDKVAARVAIRSHNLSGLYHNSGIGPGGVVDPSLAGKRIGRERSLTVRPTLRVTPTERLDIQFIAEISRERDQASPQLSLPLAGSKVVAYGGTVANPFGDPHYGIPSDGSDPYLTGFSLSGRPMDFDTNSFTLDASYDTGVGKVRFLGNHQTTHSEVWADGDGSVANIRSSGRYEDYSANSAELQYVSNFSEKLDVIAGALYFHDQYKTTQLSFTQDGTDIVPVFDVDNYLVPTGPGAICTATNKVGCTYPNFNVTYINNGGKRNAYAAYAQLEYHFTHKLSLVAGLRYSDEKKYDYYGTNALLGTTGLPKTIDPFLHALPTAPGLLFTAAPYKNHNFAPRVGLNYKLSSDILLFAFWQRAYKSGGFNANSADLAAFQTPYGTERVDNFEGGVKSEFFDHKLRINLNGFYAKYDGLQRSLVTPSFSAPSGVTTVTSNAVDLNSYGIEAEIAIRPVRQLTLFSNIGWDHAYYTKYCADLNGAEATPTPTLDTTHPVCGPVTTVRTPAGAVAGYLVPQNYSSLVPIRAPRWDVTGGITKEVTVGQGTVTGTASVNYRSSLATDLLNRPYSFRPSMVLVDASLRWAPDNGRYWVSLWGRNLTNKVELLSYTPNGVVVAFGAPTPPRTYGVTMNVSF